MYMEGMTVEDLVAEYNRHSPVEPLKQWRGGQDLLTAMARVTRKQSTPHGIVDIVSIVTGS